MPRCQPAPSHCTPFTAEDGLREAEQVLRPTQLCFLYSLSLYPTDKETEVLGARARGQGPTGGWAQSPSLGHCIARPSVGRQDRQNHHSKGGQGSSRTCRGVRREGHVALTLGTARLDGDSRHRLLSTRKAPSTNPVPAPCREPDAQRVGE